MQSLADRADKVGTRLKDLGQKMSLFITTPILGAAGASIKMASDMEESQNKIAVIFGDSAKEIEAWSDGTIQSIGLASQTALDSVALFGDMATGMGISADQAQDMSIKLTELSGDLASFKNIRQDVAETALKSVFTGETESLKNLGIVMTEANLAAYAMSEGITKNISDMTQAEKVNLRYKFVLDATASAQGDFERTQNSAANQARIFQESVKNLGVEFGENMLPTFVRVIEKVNSLVQWFGSLDEGTQNFIITAGLLVAAVGPVLIILGQAMVAVKALGAAFAFVAATPGAAMIALIGALVASGLYLIENWDKIKEDWKLTWEYIKDATKPAVDAISGWLEGLVSWIKSIWEWLEKLLGKAVAVANKLKSVMGMSSGNSGATLVSSVASNFADGGMVYAQSGFQARGTDIVPAMLTPGEVVLNAAQQRNVASHINGQPTINITVNGDVTGEEIVDRVGDALTKKLFLHSAVV